MYMVRRSRTPQGVRGLKPRNGNLNGRDCVSHSARSAWIETELRMLNIPSCSVALRKECVD